MAVFGVSGQPHMLLGTWYEVARGGWFVEPKANHVLMLVQHANGTMRWLESWDGEQRDLEARLERDTLCVKTLPFWWSLYKVVAHSEAFLVLAGTFTTRLYSAKPTMDAVTWHEASSIMRLMDYNTQWLEWSPSPVDGLDDVLKPRDAAQHPRHGSVEWMN